MHSWPPCILFYDYSKLHNLLVDMIQRLATKQHMPFTYITITSDQYTELFYIVEKVNYNTICDKYKHKLYIVT
jgi:hypothetical protein